ncbi:PepSY-associated TM helix domain-containing protein [Acinetobacter larvae]|uniref:Peptidase n=1 Tax=Acinetobacter larvae TaxID=1789224 RepID=A0A1B2LZU2_9GAMM|nr:PepSY-associated TM helix domain-containing protein [Acinetobacter larvae]AOA58468.1 hypothetical protein BFG52_08945 [Acinetobacter larvae]
MKEGFRQCMAWLHTWTGLVVGWVLFFVFLTGTAGYVQVELTRWMQPERALLSNDIPSVEQQLSKAYQFLQTDPQAQQAERWGISIMSKHRGQDEFAVNWSMPAEEGQRYGRYQQQALDLQTGQALADQVKARETGGGFTLYRMHYALHYLPYDWAIRIVGICTMFMFVAIITGVITHKKIFKDFFTFRPAKGQRSWLDVHNVLSVIALPFYIMITYSGLIFFLNAYMPLGMPMVYGFGDQGRDRYYAELYQSNRYSSQQNQQKIQPLGQSAKQFVEIMPILQQVQQQWGPQQISSINLYPSKSNDPAKIEFYKINTDKVARSRDSLQFNLTTGQQIQEGQSNQDRAAMQFGSTVLGLHEGSFAAPLLRVLYVITGLLGTAMIATGLVLWTVKRRPKQIKAGKMTFGHALVERLNIALVAGLPLAIAVYFWANRLIPANFAERAAWEVHSMYICLLLCFIYALCRPIVRAWLEILCLAAVAYLFLPILNVLTSARHLGVTLAHGDYALASVDIGFFLFGLLLAWATYAVWRKRAVILQKPQPKKRVPAAKNVVSSKTSEDES